MDICRLCFQYKTGEEELNSDSDIKDALTGLQEFIPFKNNLVNKSAVICDTCISNVQTSRDLIFTIKATESKILEAIKNNKSDKIDINTLHEKVNALPPEMKQCVTMCRLCLNFIPQSKIFLCENNSNILHYKMLQNMLEFCKVSMNLELTEKPSMCLKCWEHLQIAYSFKKNFLEIEEQIKIYSQKFHLRNKQVDKNMLTKIKQFLIDKVEPSDKSEDESAENDDDFDTKRIQFEHSYIKTPELKPKPKIILKNHQKKRIFTKDEDHALIKSYFEATKNEQNFYPGYWKKIHSMWLNMCSIDSIPICSLQNRLSGLLRNKSISREAIDKIKTDVARQNNIHMNNLGMRNNKKRHDINQRKYRKHKEHETTCDNIVDVSVNQMECNPISENAIIIKNEPFSDSDDSFTEEACKSSFTPHVKTDPLSDSDSEIDVVESRIERFSDEWDSLPQLERMDIPPITFKIDKIYSLDEKKSALNSVINDIYLEPNIEVEEVKTCRKFSFKNQMEEGLFKCLSCNFETKSRKSADIHSLWHSKGKNSKKLHKCPVCPYKISNKKLLKNHEKLHKEEDDIPVLLPMYT